MEGHLMKNMGKNIVLSIALVGTLSSAGSLSSIDKEYQKSDESGKLRKFYEKMGELDGAGNAAILIPAKKAGEEMERFANAGSDLAVCNLADFYGPQGSNTNYHENFNLSLKWLIEGEKRGLQCGINWKWPPEILNISEAKAEKLTSLEYLMIAVKSFSSSKELEQQYPYYFKAKEWLKVKKNLKSNTSKVAQ